MAEKVEEEKETVVSVITKRFEELVRSHTEVVPKFDERMRQLRETTESELNNLQKRRQDLKEKVDPSDLTKYARKYLPPSKAPRPVRHVLKSVLMIMGKENYTWKDIVKFLRNESVLDEIVSFEITDVWPDVGIVPPNVRDSIDEFVSKKEGSFDINTLSTAAPPLVFVCEWMQALLEYSKAFDRERYGKMDQDKMGNLLNEFDVIRGNIKKLEELEAQNEGDPSEELVKEVESLLQESEQSLQYLQKQNGLCIII